MFDLSNKVAVIAGGAGYLGGPVSRGLAEQGARVVVADIDEERAQQLVSDLNQALIADRPPALVLPLDVTKPASMTALVEEVRARCGGIDILVNATYAPHGAGTDQLTAPAFTEAMQTNLTNCFLLVRAAKEAMARGGSIVLFSSMYGRVAPDPRTYEKPLEPNPIEYGVAKAGIEQMVRYLAVAWGAEGVRVNAVAPGAFPNSKVQTAHPDFIKRLAAKVPSGRIGRPDEIAGAVVYLASDEASYVTGHTLVVDGGWTVW